MSGNRARPGVKYDVSLQQQRLSDVREPENQRIRDIRELREIREIRYSEKKSQEKSARLWSARLGSVGLWRAPRVSYILN